VKLLYTLRDIHVVELGIFWIRYSEFYTVTFFMDDRYMALICRGAQRGKMLGPKWEEVKKEAKLGCMNLSNTTV